MAYNSANFNYLAEGPVNGRIFEYNTTDNLSVMDTNNFYFNDFDTALKLRTGDWIEITAADKNALFRVGSVAPSQSGLVSASKFIEVSVFTGDNF